MSSELRQCNKCKELKSLDSFSKKKRGPSGLDWYCRACLSNQYKEKIKRNPDWSKQKLEKQRAWLIANPDKYSVYKQKTIEWVKVNPQYQKEWYQSNKKLRNEINARWLKQNPEKRKEYARKRRISKRGSRSFKVLPKELRRLKSQPCFYCGSKENITVDHVIPLSRGGYDSIGNILPACISCNSQKNARFIMEYRLGKPVSRKVQL